LREKYKSIQLPEEGDWMSDTSNRGPTGAQGTTGTSGSSSAEGRGPFPDLTAILNQFKLPGVDLHAIMESRKADFEALVKANTLAIQGAQKIAEKQAELFRASLNDLAELLRQAPQAAQDPAGTMGRQSELVQAAITRALNSMKELAEVTRKSQADALEVVSQRARQNITELRNLLQRSPSSS